jgi:hypothetical protein
LFGVKPAKETTVELTNEFVTAVEHGASALRTNAERLARNDKAKTDDAVGRIVRKAIESDLQTADVLAGWAKRARESLLDVEHQ